MSIQIEVTVINPTSIYGPNYFHQSRLHFKKERVYIANISFIIPASVRPNNELFHQSSFNLKNIA